MISASSPWRLTGAVPFIIWNKTILAAGGPADLASYRTWDAASDLSALCLAQLGEESSYATQHGADPASNKNPLNLRPRGGDGFMAFDDYAKCIVNWRTRLLDPGYAYKDTVSIADLIAVYAPASDSNDTKAYIRNVVQRLTLWQQGGTVVPDSLTFGKVPYPSVIQSHLPASNPMVETSGAPDIPDAVVWHRMVGTFRGTDGYFHGGNAATCYGIGCEATDGTADAGKLFEWIAPRTGWYGESSGPVSNPYGDGLALVNKVGVNSANRVTKALEISGNYDTPLDEACRAALVAMTAYWADQKQIPWNAFPAVPGENRSFVIWHQELTIGTGKICPGPVVMNETPALIERVALYLKTFQVGGTVTKPPAYAPSIVSTLPWWDDALKDLHPTDQHDADGTRWLAIRRNELCEIQTSRLSAPDAAAKHSGPPVKKDEKVFVERLVVKGAKRFWATVDGHFVLASKFKPDWRVH